MSGRFKSSWIKLLRWLATPFVYIFDTLKLSISLGRQKSKFYSPEQNPGAEQRAEQQTKLYNLGEVVTYRFGKIQLVLRCIAFVSLMIYINAAILGSVETTDIHVDMISSEVLIDDVKSSGDHQTAQKLHGRGKIMASMPNEQPNPLSGDYYAMESGGSPAPLAIGFPIPLKCGILLSSKDTSQVKITISPREKLDFNYKIYGDTGTNIHRDSSPHEINVFKKNGYLSPDKQFSIVVNSPVSYKLDPLVVAKLHFGETNDITNALESSIITGAVYLKDTKDDSIKLYQGYYLDIIPTKPFKVFISKVPEGFHIVFDVNVSSLFVHSLDEEKPTNNMPLKIKTNFDQYPYLWVVIPVLLPFLLGLFKSRRTW